MLTADRSNNGSAHPVAYKAQNAALGPIGRFGGLDGGFFRTASSRNALRRRVNLPVQSRDLVGTLRWIPQRLFLSQAFNTSPDQLDTPRNARGKQNRGQQASHGSQRCIEPQKGRFGRDS